MKQQRTTLEQQILAEVAAKERMIRELQQECDALRRMLVSSRKKEVSDREAIRRTSISRVLAEEAIVARLRSQAPKADTVTQLWIAAAEAGVQSKATFRSHLHRLKLKGLIKPSKIRGMWVLAPDTAAAQQPVEHYDL